MRYSLILLVCVVLTHWKTPTQAQTAAGVLKVSITVADLEKSVKFYQEVLTFRKVREYAWSGAALQKLTGEKNTDLEAKVALLQLGDEQIELVEFVHEARQAQIPADSKSNDLWFQHIAIVVRDMDKAYQILRQNKVQFVSTAPQTLPDYIPAATGIKAFYFRDPDGHNLEVIYFPLGKGKTKWQQKTEAIFLGIDHTAIGIDDTDRSQKFYENLLGLKKAGDSENYGPEQEHLNQVFGAHLIITGLVAKQGFGVEFLDYLAPPGGRPYPENSRVTDLWHWHTSIEVDQIEAVYARLQEANCDFISQGIVLFENQKSLMVRDPDGHAVLLLQKK
ncbi:MAG: VOC family protein [Microscillaceae bacterium]|nr:VOC family protein [Microscillaceae bacterium]